jgi:hypothetical protein
MVEICSLPRLSQTWGARLPGRAEGRYSVTGSSATTRGVPSGTTAIDS